MLIGIFWFSTLIAELFGTKAQIITVKTAIPWGFLLLVPALAAAGGSGAIHSRGRRGGFIDRKMRRMPVIAANGLLVLIPAALFLSWKAGADEIDGAFYAVQALELLAGAVNFTLLALNMRDGLRMTGRLSKRPRKRLQL
ncbi:hypothetical protein I6A82_03535 [Novosphingopyxis sp. YJ-S2-01]|nr:hypothetical protein [Novosphingopyxis sp. YJ-S2-01]